MEQIKAFFIKGGVLPAMKLVLKEKQVFYGPKYCFELFFVYS